MGHMWYGSSLTLDVPFPLHSLLAFMSAMIRARPACCGVGDFGRRLGPSRSVSVIGCTARQATGRYGPALYAHCTDVT